MELFRHGFPVVPVHIIDELSFASAIYGNVGGLPVIDI
jgi:hypothetical protein